MKTKIVTPKKEKDGWAYIRVRKSTRKRLQIMKAELNLEAYDNAIDITLNNFEKTKNEKTKKSSSQGK